jgi:hypothetical protein
MYRPKDKLDIEVEMIWKLMRKVSKKKKTTVRKKINNNKKVTITYCERKSSGALQHKMWNPGEVQATTKQHQNREADGASGRIQYRVWDPGGFHQHVKHMIRRS